jgi:hypothetical protein
MDYLQEIGHLCFAIIASFIFCFGGCESVFDCSLLHNMKRFHSNLICIAGTL